MTRSLEQAGCVWACLLIFGVLRCLAQCQPASQPTTEAALVSEQPGAEETLAELGDAARIPLSDPGRLLSLAMVVVGLSVTAVAYWQYKRRAGSGQETWRVVILLGVLAVLYGLLFNGQWLPGSGDESLYLAIARNVAATGDFVWNGSPVLTVPFGWPYLVAWAMKISGAFVFLNLLPLGLVVLALTLWYLVLRKLISPDWALGLVLLTAVLFHWQRCAVRFYSEAVFLMLVPLGLLLAMQVAEGRPWGWRAPALLAVCATMVLSRFAGLLTMPLLVAALLAGQPRFGSWRPWVLAVLVCVVLVGSFFGMRSVLQWSAKRYVSRTLEQARILEAAVQSATEVDRAVLTQRLEAMKCAEVAVESADRDTAVNDRMVGRAARAGLREYVRRGTVFGVWLSRLFWPPAEMGKTDQRLKQISNLLGWALLAPLLAGLPRAVRERQWIWAGLVAYCAVFVLVWPEPNGRHLVSAAPLLLLGLLKGLAVLIAWANRAWARHALRLLASLILGSILGCNLMIYAGEAYVSQSPQFHSLTLAGEHKELIAVCEHLNRQKLGDFELAVAQDTGYKQILRMSSFLTDRTILTAPTAGRPTAKTFAWAQTNGVRYYLCRPPRTPRRIWHLRLEDGGAYLELYELRNGQAVKLELPEPVRVDRVVGLESRRAAGPSTL